MPKIEKAFVQVYICLVVALFLWSAFNSIRFPYGVDYGEAPLMDQARRLLNNEPLYKADVNLAPYVIANYPPLFPSLVAITKSILNTPYFQTGRIISFLFTLLSAYIIGLFSSNLTKNKWLGVFSAAIFLGLPYVIFWSSLARVDQMALGLSLLGLWLLYRYPDSSLGIIFATICFLASVFTRQTYLISGPLAGAIWLWHINRNRSLLFIALYSLSGFLIFGTINALTHNGFYANIVLSNVNDFNLMHTLSVGAQLFLIWPMIILATLVAVALTIYARISSNSLEELHVLRQPFIFHGLIFYTLGSLISAVAVGKIGSNVNYLLELVAACSIWVGIAWKLILEQKRNLRWAFFGLLVVQSLWVLSTSYGLVQQNTQRLAQRLKIDTTLSQRISQVADAGIILSDDYMDLIVQAGQPVYYQPFEYGELYLAGRWDPSVFINQILRKEFPLIIIGGNTLNKDCCWPAPVISALEANYQVESSENMLILTPLK